jgi:hypothetical protein
MIGRRFLFLSLGLITLLVTFTWGPVLFFVGLITARQAILGPTEIVVPVDFQGDFKMFCNDRAAIEPRHVDGKRVYLVPVTGLLRIRDEGPFRGEVVTARFSDGKRLEIVNDPASIAPTTVALRPPLGVLCENAAPGKSELWFYVGTPAGYAKSERP